MSLDDLIKKLKSKNIYDVAHGLWLSILYPYYENKQLDENKLLYLLDLKE